MTMRSHLLLLAICSSAGAAETYDSPFVAGFDRFFRDSEDDAAAGGRLLISELSCAACHRTDDSLLLPKRGPQLFGAGRRIRSDWLRRYLADPQSVKPGTTMPNMLHSIPDDRKRQTVNALVAFLSQQPAGFPLLDSTAGNPIAQEFWRKGDRDRGRRLYHQVGCVACHEPRDDHETTPYQGSELEKLLSQLEPDEIEELGLTDAARPVRSVPHGDLPSKYTLRSLTFFLYAPERTRPAGRMPNLKLRPDEAADIAAYLLGDDATIDQPERTPDSAELIGTGRRLFAELRCVQCHSIDNIKPTAPAKSLAEVDPDAETTCFDEAVAGVPQYALSGNQLAAVRDALNDVGAESSIADTVHDRMLKLNCYACHERNRRGGVGPKRRRYFETTSHVDIGDEGRMPPPLDGVGRKLTLKSLAAFLQGKTSVRPHMHVRMPAFAGDEPASLPGEFVRADRDVQPSEQDVFGNTADLAASGRELFNTGCVQCHPVRGEHLTGVVGVDVAGTTNRIRPQWFHDFLLNPVQLKARTRMPTFFPNGRSSNREILEGNVERQIASLWAYLKDVEKQPLPQKIIDGKAHNFELIPDRRPIVLRTFMKDAGTHAIAVGFPSKTHIAFDADIVRPAQAWRGRFLDAHGTWYDRFTPLAEPLGNDVVRFPPGVPFAVLPSRDSPWPANRRAGVRFRGYRLDQTRTPTFLYRIGDSEIEDRIAPDGHGGLNRSLHVARNSESSDDPFPLWFRANAGKTIRREGTRSTVNQDGLTVTVSKSIGQGELRGLDGLTEWVIPVDIDREMSFEVNYRW